METLIRPHPWRRHQYCRNPLHPGPCARVRFDVPGVHLHEGRYRVPPGIDVSGLNDGGWTPDHPQVAEIATIAHHYGFTRVIHGGAGPPRPDTYLARVSDEHGAETLILGNQEGWANPAKWRRHSAEAQLPAQVRGRTGRDWITLPADRRFHMAEADGVASIAQYVIPHEAGHRDARVKGQITRMGERRYDRMGAALAAYARSKRLRAPDGTPYVASDFSRPQPPHRLATLLSNGWSEYSIGTPSEMYAEFFAAYQLGSDDEAVHALAQEMGWTR